MSDIPKCPKCESVYVYLDRTIFVCPECAHEFSAEASQDADETIIVKDANGNILKDGDTVTVIKDLKLKGSSSVIKVGTKAKNIRLVEGDHDIDCKVAEHGAIKLKSQFVKKA